MKKVFLVTLFCFLSFSLFAQNEITGEWKTEDKEATVRIYRGDNGKYYGKITWLKTPNDKNGKPFTDTENPDKSLRAEPLLGLVLLKSFTFSDGEWKDGTIYDPNEGKTYNAKVWLTGSDTLNVRGYWGLFYKTEKWVRIK